MPLVGAEFILTAGSSCRFDLFFMGFYACRQDSRSLGNRSISVDSYDWAR